MIRVITLLAVLSAFATTVTAQRYTFQFFSQEQGLTNLTPQCMLQDREGFLWIGTQNGLFRYDGARFTYYGVSEGLPTSSIEALLEGLDGTIWVGSSGGLARRSKSQLKPFAPVTLPPGTSAPRQNSLAQDSRGFLYLGTLSGLIVGTPVKRDGKSGSEYKFERVPFGTTGISGVYVDQSDAVLFWCGSQICQYESGAIRAISPDLGEALTKTGALLGDSRGNLWARNSRGLFEREKGQSVWRDRSEGLPDSNSYSSLSMDREGTLLVPTDLGLAMLKSTSWEIIGKNRGLGTNSTTISFQDREGSLWIGLGGAGLARMRGYKQWEAWTDAEGLGNDNVWAITRDPSGGVWIGNDVGLYRMGSGEDGRRKWEQVRLGGKAQTIDHLVTDEQGNVWAGGSSGVLARVDPKSKRVTVYGTADGLADNRVGGMAFDGEGNLWLTTRAGVLRSHRAGPFLRFDTVSIPGIADSILLRTLFRDRENRLWVTGKGVLLLLDKGQWQIFTTRDGVHDETIERIAQAKDGTIWLGYRTLPQLARLTFNSGKVHIEHEVARPRPASVLTIGLASDVFGRIWQSTDDGVDFREGGKWRHFGLSDGLFWDDCNGNAIYADRDGSMWFGTSRGLSHFQMPSVEVTQPPTVAIIDVRFGGKEWTIDSKADVPHADHTFEVDFAVQSFATEGGAKYKYRLRGLEDNWTVTDKPQVRYSSLAGGKYTFEVMAYTASGLWSPKPAVLTFSIETAWWQTWLFRIACLIALVTGASQIFMYRVRRILQVQRELSEQVEQRTAELRREQARVLEEKHNVEKQNAEIERLLREAQRAMQYKNQFLANMSHEIRTPMNGIIGMTELTLDSELSQEQRDHLQLVRASAKSLLSVINDILDFSKIEAGKLDLDSIEFQLREQLSSLLAMFTLRAREKGLVMTSRVDGNVPDGLIGDPGRLRQILVNLIGNALKFTVKGEITVGVRILPEAEDTSKSPDSVTLHFSVRDTGIGITEEQQDLIFEPFRQGDGSITRKYGGTGLGLSICSQLSTLMNGTLWMESEAGKGSIFHFTARFQKATPLSRSMTGRRKHSIVASANRSLRVLVAEDNAINQRLMVKLLENRGHLVRLVSTGLDVLSATQRQAFDVVLMDVQMPGMGGFEATAALRERERSSGQHIRIVAVTASAMVGDRERCLAAGMDEYLAKPIDAESLYRAIEAPPKGAGPPVDGVSEGRGAPGAAVV